MQKCDKSTYQKNVEAIVMPNNKHQIIMNMSTNIRCIYQEHMS